MELRVLDSGTDWLRAGYTCPCGCTPALDYRQGGAVVEDGCCCGNHFAVGPNAGASLEPRAGFRSALTTFAAPWGQLLDAAWLVGPSVHGHEGEGHPHEHSDEVEVATDPVCGMSVELESARAKDLASVHGTIEYFFCGRGCKLDFNEDPARYLDPTYVPSM